MFAEKRLSQLTGDMYEFYQWLKSKCSGVVGVDVTYGKTHYDGSEDVCMTFQLKYQWENEMDKRKDAGIHRIISIMEYIAKKFGWGIDIKWFNSYRAATDDVLTIKLINQKENLTSEVKSKMKKLNITKEAFEKSKYFTKKYGKLEYVSESGKLFKTEKGKVLKFVKESCDEEFDRYYERMKKIFRYDSGIHIRLRDNEDGSETIEVTFDDRFNWDDDVVSGRIPLDEDYLLLDWITRFDEQAHRNGWEFDYELADDIEHPIDGGANNDYLAMLTLTCKCDKEEDDDLLFESSDGKLDNPEALIKFIRGLPDGDEYLFQDGGKWIATNEWLCGTFAGKEFEGDTEEEAVQQLIDYLNLHIGHNSMVGQTVTKSGWPIASKVAEYVGPEEEEVDESAMPLKGDQETGTMAKVNDLVSKAYANLYDELKKAGIDFDSASDDGFYVNDPDAQKTYFINLYVNECEEYEGSYK